MIAFACCLFARSRLGVVSSALVFLVSAALPLGAQGGEAKGAKACLDTLSTSAFVRVPVYLEAKAADSSARAFLPTADSLGARVAAMIRSSLGEPTTSLPEGEMLLQWRQVGGSVQIVAHRDGHFTWSAPPRTEQDTLHAASRQLLLGAVKALSDAGVKIGWPADIAGDSVAFELAYRWPDVNPEGRMQPLLVRIAAAPMFSMAMPRSKEVGVLRPPRIVYPANLGLGTAEGRVTLEFVVDTAGRVVKSTITDKPTDRSRLTGQFAVHYQAFLNAATWGLSTARFEPATVGGCRVSQVAQQPFDFTLTH